MRRVEHASHPESPGYDHWCVHEAETVVRRLKSTRSARELLTELLRARVPESQAGYVVEELLKSKKVTLLIGEFV